MKKLSYYLSATASLALAVCMSISLSSCNKEDNPVNPDQGKGEAKLIIKEIAVSGGFKTTENKSYNWCKAITVYNNSNVKATIKNLGIGNVGDTNAHAALIKKNYDENGVLLYENSGFTPIWSQVWYIPEITIEPYSDAVIAVNGAIDHTIVAPEAYNLADASYYAMYDPENGANNANAYPVPFEGIPASHYFKVINLFTTNAWPGSMMCPSIVLFQFPENVDPRTYCDKEGENIYYTGNTPTANGSNICVKIPNEWILDGAEFFRIGFESESFKRLAKSIDTSFGLYNSNKKYSAYRNVDKAATEAIAENAGKLVYDYDQAVEGTNEPSGIDAAASIKNGAKIVYQDTNNSSADFHLRKAWSLK